MPTSLFFDFVNLFNTIVKSSSGFISESEDSYIYQEICSKYEEIRGKYEEM